MGGTFIPKNPKKPKMDIPLRASVIVGPWSATRARPVTMMTDVSSSRTADMILPALFAYTT